MANAQKRGFRFPWGGDVQSDAALSPEDAGDAVDAGNPGDVGDLRDDGFSDRLNALTDELGTGPFDLRSDDGEDARSGSTAPDGRASTEPEPATASEPAPAATAASAAPTRPKAPTQAQAAQAEEESSVTQPGESWPDRDRRGPNRPFATPAPAGPAGAAAPRRASNPLVAGLVKAMREAAQAARDEAVTTLRAEAAAREESIRADATALVGQLRKTADDDIAGIRDWSKAELARVREETEQRIAARREQLTAETEAGARASEATIERLGEAIQAFEAETAAFFEALLAEDDPARLAGLAERMPQPPSLDEFAVGVAAADADSAVETRRDDASQDDTDATEDLEPTGSEAPDGPATAVQVDDHLDADAAAAAEAAALDGLDGQTQLLVSGLDGMAAIAAFKSALLHVQGVSAVSVLATNGPELQFNVTHDAEADVRDGLRGLPGFRARVIGDDGSSVAVVATAVAA